MSGSRIRVVGGLALALVVAAGCTSVQKGSAVGGVVGGGTGAAVGHYASSIGGVPGGLIGLGLGATAGAVAGEHFYGTQDNEDLAEMTAELEALQAEVDAKDSELSANRDALDREKAQQRALLEQYDKLRNSRAKLQADAPANVEVSAEKDKITYTILSEVLFDSGRAELTGPGRSALHQAVSAIRRRYPNARIDVRGHTDNVPIKYSSYKSNWDLSCSRAVAVVHYLIESEGFNPERLTAVGCGETRPVASNGSAAGRRKNRRAELVVRPGDVKVAEVRKSQ